MPNLMLHDDWEIYGDGTGHPEKLMFDPARRLLDICDQYGAKYTFYAEIGQQLNMLNAPGGRWSWYAGIWEEILKDALARGHDVQMHFHPQWIGAELVNGQWKLDFSKWNTARVEEDLLDEWVGKGAAYLRGLLQGIDPEYELLSYRAGGWMCQPSTFLYRVLKKYGIVCDVSVMKGRYKRFADGGLIDFRNAPSRFEPWEVDPDDFALEKQGSGLWELPVFTETSRIPHPIYLLSKSFAPLHYYRILKKRKIQKGGGQYSPKVVESSDHKDFYGSFGYMHYRHLMNYVRVTQRHNQPDKKQRHLIFLTHSKSFLGFGNFEKLLYMLSQMDEIRFSRTRDYIKEII
ncbi:MAG: hypothetical protein ACOC1Q_01860 [Desulfosalsimonas sp.]